MSPPSANRNLLARLRVAMAAGQLSLAELTRLVTEELSARVCTIYVMRPGDTLELLATTGLRPEAVGHTKLRVGEGIVGLAAATSRVMNLPDAHNHPAFVYRAETGEAAFAALLAVPVRRTGRTFGVLVVQDTDARQFSSDEVEVLETVAMLVAEMLATRGVATDGVEQSLGVALPRQFAGTQLAPGLVIGPVATLAPLSAPARLLAEDADLELTRLNQAVGAMRAELDALIESRMPDGDEPREVLQATRLVAASEGWMRRVQDAISGGLTASAAVHRVAGEMRDRMRRLPDPYLRERLADIEDLAARLIAALDGDALPAVLAPGSILLVRQLGPAKLLELVASGIAGVVIEEGSPAGHAAILARALGLPAVGGVRGAIDTCEAGDDAVLDAEEGVLFLRPPEELRQTYARVLVTRAQRAAGWAALRHRKARTRDGVPITLMLNAGLKIELDQLDETGAEGIGLFRTEIAALARGSVADTAEQAALYAQVLDVAGDRPVLFRTLDLGGDKLLPESPSSVEENPALGWRSLRIGLDRPVLLRRQLRALLLAASGRPLSVMFPMVATVAEFMAARSLFEAEVARLGSRPQGLRVGAMLEVPSLLWQLPALAEAVDFLSIGSNDLMQFLFAADRGTPGLAARYDIVSAPVLDLLEHTRRASEAAGIALSVCGEAAGKPLEALVFAALGIRTLSMPAGRVLPLKALLAEADLEGFAAVLAALRRSGGAEPSLREPLLAWARENGIAL